MVTRLLHCIAIWLIYSASAGFAQDQQAKRPPVPTTPPKPGRYVPELYGGHRGRYTPDHSGKYQHQHVPYDGGYGDRGQPYVGIFGVSRSGEGEDSQMTTSGFDEFALGPRDHLRFMIDFNYNGTGWQIIQFEWLRDGQDDGTDKRHYSYINENKLWDDVEFVNEPQSSYNYEQPQDSHDDHVNGDHVDEEYEQSDYPVPENTNENVKSDANTRIEMKKLRDAITEVLDYIQSNILPTIN